MSAKRPAGTYVLRHLLHFLLTVNLPGSPGTQKERNTK